MNTTPHKDGLQVLLWSPKGVGLHYGGPGMTAYRLYRKAQQGSFAITLAHGKENHEDYDLFHSNCLITPLPTQPVSGIKTIQLQRRFIQSGKQWVRENASRFDVFHGLQGFDLTMEPALEAIKNGLPAVVKLATHKSDLADKPGWKQILGRPRRRRKLANQLSAIIAISTSIRDELLSYGLPEDKIALIPNGVDTDQFHPVDERTRSQRRLALGWPDRKTILFTGTLVPRKRPHLLVKALKELRQQGTDAQLVLAGPETDQAYVQNMKRAAEDANITEHIIYPGFTPEVAPLYQAADAFALPSESEGMPNALLEAMASGLPCLATDISGSRDLVEHGHTGLLAEPTVDDITQAIRLLLSESGKRLGHVARGAIEQTYASNVILDQHQRLFRKIMKGS